MLRSVAVLVAVVGGVAGCTSYQAVPLREGEFPLGSVRVGDEVRAETRSGQALSFEVVSVDGGRALVADSGEQVVAAELDSLEIARRDKHKTHVALAVVGGVVAAGLILGNAEATVMCAEYNADVCDGKLLR